MPTRELHPSLIAALTEADVALDSFSLAWPVATDATRARNEIVLVDNDNHLAFWKVKSLGSLIRGNGVPPPMNEFPDDYIPVFEQIERAILIHASMGRRPTDAELEEVFSNLARGREPRRPDPTHDAVWQCVAVALGRFTLSEAEIVAIIQRLGKSARSFKMSATSRDYLKHIGGMFGS